MKRFSMFLMAALAIAMVWGAASASAEFVSYSFTSNSTLTSQTGAGVIGTATDQWMTEFIPVDENARAVDDVALIDVNGAATSATLSHLGLRQHNTAGQVLASGNPVPLKSSVYMRHATDPSRMLLFEGLLPGSTADIVLFGTYHLTGIDRGSNFTIGGTTKSTTGTGSRTSFGENRNYVFFDDVLVGTSGSIQVDIAGNATDFSDLNGFQIEFTPVPEPSTLVLAGLGLLGLCLRRRRR